MLPLSMEGLRDLKFRDENLMRLSALPQAPVVIFGGGVNGVAILRELALNEVSAVLLDIGDFCQGATNASSRMAHGGLRYLEQREFSLVREAVHERDLLLKYAPHAVEPVTFFVPLEHRMRGALQSVLAVAGMSKRKISLNATTLRLGLFVYRWFSTSLKSAQVHITRPMMLNPAFRSYLTYQDGKLSNPESLVFEMLSEAITANENTVALNYVTWRFEAGAVVVTYDGLPKPVRITPSLIVNATGVAVDGVNAELGCPTAYVSAVRGAHIVVKHDALHQRMDGRAFYLDDGDGRMVIAAPHSNTVLMGTTEVKAEGNAVNPDEIVYLKTALSRLFTDINIGDTDIVAVTSGARPIRRNEAQNANSASRNHEIAITNSDGLPVFTLIGGKWTTFRAFGEQMADRVLDVLGAARIVSTKTRSYLGTPDADTKQANTAREKTLMRRYGALWSQIAAFCEVNDEMPLSHAPTYTRQEIIWLIKNRSVCNLDDIVLRRTTLALDGNASDALLSELAVILADTLSKSAHWAGAQVARCSALPAIRFRPDLEHSDEG